MPWRARSVLLIRGAVRDFIRHVQVLLIVPMDIVMYMVYNSSKDFVSVTIKNMGDK